MIFVRFVDGTGAVVSVVSAFLFLDAMFTELNSSSAVLPAAVSMEVMSEKKPSRSSMFVFLEGVYGTEWETSFFYEATLMKERMIVL